MSQEQTIESLSRREALLLAAGATIAAAGGVLLSAGAARADRAAVDAAIRARIGDAQPVEGGIDLKLPQVAEDGNTVPLDVHVASPMTGDDHVTAVHLFADANPAPEIASYYFTPMSGRAEVSTRIRLARSQKVYAVAEMSDGRLFKAVREVTVTVGGCGG